MEPKPEQEPSSSRWHRTKQRLQLLLEDPLWRLLILLAEIGAVAAGVWALFLALDQTKLAQDALLDQRISSAWQILALPNSGSNGKAYALETLSKLDQRVIGLDLSCDSGLDPACRPAVLNGLQLVKSRPSDTWSSDIVDSNFTDAEMRNSRWSNVTLELVHLNRATISGVLESVSLAANDFSSAELEHLEIRQSWLGSNDLSGATFADATFDHVTLVGNDFTGANFSRAAFTAIDGSLNDISGAIFCDGPVEEILMLYTGGNADGRLLDRCGRSGELSQSFLDTAFYMEGNPPVDLYLFGEKLEIAGPCSRAVGRNGEIACPAGKHSVRDLMPEEIKLKWLLVPEAQRE